MQKRDFKRFFELLHTFSRTLVCAAKKQEGTADRIKSFPMGRSLLKRTRPITDTASKKGSPYSITERRVPELIPVLGSQPSGDVCHIPGYRLPFRQAHSYPRNP